LQSLSKQGLLCNTLHCFAAPAEYSMCIARAFLLLQLAKLEQAGAALGLLLEVARCADGWHALKG